MMDDDKHAPTSFEVDDTVYLRHGRPKCSPTPAGHSRSRKALPPEPVATDGREKFETERAVVLREPRKHNLIANATSAGQILNKPLSHCGASTVPPYCILFSPSNMALMLLVRAYKDMSKVVLHTSAASKGQERPKVAELRATTGNEGNKDEGNRPGNNGIDGSRAEDEDDQENAHTRFSRLKYDRVQGGGCQEMNPLGQAMVFRGPFCGFRRILNPTSDLPDLLNIFNEGCMPTLSGVMFELGPEP
ncbi:hypothetical protein DL768_009648 [Monosporascus sp. mg162]|nr:hypothetical protein DL768_009648 [Monosporascus sp. mg162]